MTPSPDLQAARIDALVKATHEVLATVQQLVPNANLSATIFEIDATEKAYHDAMAGDVAADPMGGERATDSDARNPGQYTRASKIPDNGRH